MFYSEYVAVMLNIAAVVSLVAGVIGGIAVADMFNSFLMFFPALIAGAISAVLFYSKRIMHEQLDALIGYKEKEEDRRRKKELEEFKNKNWPK